MAVFRASSVLLLHDVPLQSTFIHAVLLPPEIFARLASRFGTMNASHTESAHRLAYKV